MKRHLMKWYKSLILIILSTLIIDSYAGTIPRFVSLRGNETNLRTGPSKNYPIKWVIKNKGEPVEIITEFEQWREIRDKDGDSGWVHEAMLNGTRHAIIKTTNPTLLFKNSDLSKKIAKLSPNLRIKLLSCKAQACYVAVDSHKGWVDRESIWGVYPNEKFD